MFLPPKNRQWAALLLASFGLAIIVSIATKFGPYAIATSFVTVWLGTWVLQARRRRGLRGKLGEASRSPASGPVEQDAETVAAGEYLFPRIGRRYDLRGTILEVVNFRTRADNRHTSIWTPFWYWVDLRALTGPNRGSIVRKVISCETFAQDPDTVHIDASGLRPLAITDGSDQRARPREEWRGRSLLRPRIGALYELEIDHYRWNAELGCTEPWIARGATLRVRAFREEWTDKKTSFPECRISADFDVLDGPGAGAEIHLDFDGFTEDKALSSGQLVPYDPVWVLSIGDVEPRTALSRLRMGD